MALNYQIMDQDQPIKIRFLQNIVVRTYIIYLKIPICSYHVKIKNYKQMQISLTPYVCRFIP